MTISQLCPILAESRSHDDGNWLKVGLMMMGTVGTTITCNQCNDIFAYWA